MPTRSPGWSSSCVRAKPGRSAVEINKLLVANLASGHYQLELTVQDLETGQSASRKKNFDVYRAADFAASGSDTVTAGSGATVQDVYAAMTEKDLDKQFKYIERIASKDERKGFKKLSVEEKRAFLESFWAERDPNPNTSENEYRNEYMVRIAYANEAFKGRFQEGWETDRGRIFLEFGQPDEIDRNPYGGNLMNHEVWHYFSVEGGVEFVFVDRRSLGKLDLVHSTARGHVRDDNWRRWLN